MAGGGRLNIPLLSDTIGPPEQVSASFRDPAGQLFRAGDRILRVIDKSACSTLEAFLASKAAAQFSSAGMFVQSRPLELDEARRVLSAARIDLLEREIVVHDLLLALLKREVVTPGEARELLDQQDRFVCCSAFTTYNLDEKKGSGSRDTPE